MDSYREDPGMFDAPSSAEAAPADDVAAAIGTDERRMHVRAYNYWVSLLDGRDFPSIEDLEPGEVEDFATHSVLLDFSCGGDNPAIPYVGGAIREECALEDNMRTIADVPSRSLLSRLTDHYMQIIANRAPVGFEAEFENPFGDSICYRGILMPFSSDGDTIDFIYGVINWKHVDEEKARAAASIAASETLAARFEIAGIEDAQPGFGAADQPLELTEMVQPVSFASEVEATETPISDPPASPPVPHFSWEDGPSSEAEAEALPLIELDPNAGLADRLSAARETAESVKAGEGRTRTALYATLALAYDFAVAAAGNPGEYAELLEDSGVKAQARAPMTPIVKLVFGIDYDKARLTEFAAALAFAQRQQVALGSFQPFIAAQAGGLKGLVAAERQARRPQARPESNADAARTRLRSIAPITLAGLASTEEFAIVIARRAADGSYQPVALVDDPSLVERAIRRAA